MVFFSVSRLPDFVDGGLDGVLLHRTHSLLRDLGFYPDDSSAQTPHHLRQLQPTGHRRFHRHSPFAMSPPKFFLPPGKSNPRYSTMRIDLSPFSYTWSANSDGQIDDAVRMERFL
jgi:hypothetical protein